jgi:uncharacterized protein (DUF885 family)
MDAHDELTGLADQYWDSMLAASPSQATVLGDHRFDDRIEDLSLEAEQRLLAQWRELLGKVTDLDVDRLSPEDRLTRSLLHTELATTVDRLAWRPLELASATSPFPARPSATRSDSWRSVGSVGWPPIGSGIGSISRHFTMWC